MTVLINNSVISTWIFIAIFLIAFFVFVRKRGDSSVFPISLTQELKGLAILAVVFAHIGYFLVTDHRFLYPLSTVAGVGVDLFLFLSGLGLAASAFKNKLPIIKFYKTQLLKLFVPFWLALIIFLSLDFFVLKITYSWQFITKAFLGIFTTADLYHDINSPLWYFTLILFYYLLFPFLFSKKRPWLSAVIIYAISYFLLWLNPAFIVGVMPFYKLHIIAFPLGILFGWLFFGGSGLTVILNKTKQLNIPKVIKFIAYYLLLIIFIAAAGYFAHHSGNGGTVTQQQLISIATMLLIVFLFLIKKIEFRLFYWFGIYSYEIYLLHWPLLYRYDIFYKYLPAWLATIFYLIFFLGLAWGFKKVSMVILDKLSSAKG